MPKGITWATITGLAGIIAAWIAITKVVLEPLEARLDLARQNYLRALVERDARMDYLQKQIDEIERRAPNGR